MIAATPAVVFTAAHDYIQSYGWVFPMPSVQVVTDAEANGLSPGGFFAAALPGLIVIPPDSARQLTVLARIIRIPNPVARARYYRDCGEDCIEAATVALHEMAHEIQWAKDAMSLDEARTEGIAEAVAVDLYPGFVRRVIGRNPGCVRLHPDAPPGYPVATWTRQGCMPAPALDYAGYVATVRRQSSSATGQTWTSPAARWWRYRQLGEAP